VGIRGFATLLVAGALAAPVAVGAAPRGAFERYRSGVVAVSYYVETTFMREVREVGGRDVGVLVEGGKVLLNGSVSTASSTGAAPHSFRVRFAGGQEMDATYLGRDEFANVAVLELNGTPPESAKPLRFEKASKLAIGDRVYAIGLLPENLEPMVRLSEGHVVAGVERPKSFVVTDLAVEDALGGPVFTEGGKLVGVLSELGEAGPSYAQDFAAGEGASLGLVVDAATIARLVESPPRKGEARRAWLGITLQALDQDKAEYFGLGQTSGIIVNSVMPGSPAAAAGLREGDILVGLDGEPVPVTQEEHVGTFIADIGSRPVGSKLKLAVVRDGERMETAVDLAAAPKSRQDAETYQSEAFDFTVRELVFTDFRAFDLPTDFRGVLVSKVEPGGWAGVGGLEGGDIIQRIDDRNIDGPTPVRQVLEEAMTQRKRKLVFFVRRTGRTQFITVQTNWSGQS
jgi:serine protease Do